jgi:hypothetical protein
MPTRLLPEWQQRRFLKRALSVTGARCNGPSFGFCSLRCSETFYLPGVAQSGFCPDSLPVAWLAQPNMKGRWRKLASCGPPIFDAFAVIHPHETSCPEGPASPLRDGRCPCVYVLVPAKLRSSYIGRPGPHLVYVPLTSIECGALFVLQRLSPSTMFSTPVCYSNNQCEIC